MEEVCMLKWCVCVRMKDSLSSQLHYNDMKKDNLVHSVNVLHYGHIIKLKKKKWRTSACDGWRIAGVKNKNGNIFSMNVAWMQTMGWSQFFFCCLIFFWNAHCSICYDSPCSCDIQYVTHNKLLITDVDVTFESICLLCYFFGILLVWCLFAVKQTLILSRTNNFIPVSVIIFF